MSRPLITLLTDFGSVDHYTGAMKGVMLGICPDAQLVDITHQIAPFAIAEGAFTLAQSWSFFPAGTVHLAVVDPGVGSSRRPLVAAAGGHLFVAPDNGLLTMVLASASHPEVREITSERTFRVPVSQTFHGRDIFAPVAAHLAGGVRPEEFGPLIEDWVRFAELTPRPDGERGISGIVLKTDRFGNITTNFPWPEGRGFELRTGLTVIGRRAASYSEMPPEELFLIRGSSGYIEVALNQGSAAALLNVRSGDSIYLRLL